MIVAVIGADTRLSLQFQSLLQSQGHRVALFADPAKAPARLAAETVHLVVVAGTGTKEATVELLKALRANAKTRVLPVLQVDPQGSTKDVVEMLDAGADDFLAKPFNDDIFLARVRTLLRRSLWSGHLPADPVVSVSAGAVAVSLVERTVRVADADVALTRLEFELLAFLLKNKDRVLKRTEILEAVWKYPQEVETRTLDKHVETLRRKLGEAGKQLKTIHGVGYRFFDAEPTAA